MDNVHSEPYIVSKRLGTSASPYLPYDETLTIDSSAKVTLTEFPNRQDKVFATGQGATWTEITKGIPTATQYKVDYGNRFVTFHTSNIGKQLNFEYRGTGLNLVSADSIYTELDAEGNVAETLGDLADRAASAINNADTILANATTKANYAQTQGDYAKAKGDAAVTATTNTVTATTNANTATSTANSKITEITNKITEATTAVTNANTATSTVNTKITEVTTKISEAATAITNANTATTNANTAATNATAIVTTFVNKGNYSSATAYVPRNNVLYNGSTYTNILACTNILPTNTTYWILSAQKGVDGTGSVNSVNGKGGDVVLIPSDIGAVATTDISATAVATKIPKYDANAKLPGSITGNADGNAATATTATKLATARTISITTDATGSATFDGSANATIALTLANSGATAGTYSKVTVDAKGRVTSGTAQTASDIPVLDWSKITSGKPTTLSGYGITDALATTALTIHTTDDISHNRYGTATGTNTLVITLSPAPSSLVTGMTIRFKNTTANTGAATLNINSLGAKSIVKNGGIALSSGYFKAGGIYTVVYDGTSFILQGEGASGNATASDLLSGKTASTDAGEITGTLVLTGNATNSDVLDGKTYYNTDAKTKQTGTLIAGKKYASGSFDSMGSTIVNEVNNLAFTPSIVLVVGISLSSAIISHQLITNNATLLGDQSTYANLSSAVSASATHDYASTNVPQYTNVSSANVVTSSNRGVITSNGFKLNSFTSGGVAPVTIRWVAIE